MAIVAGDWTVTRSSGNIRYVGTDHGAAGASYATVIQLHRWLEGLADDPTSSGDDQLDATDVLPSSRATDNLITLLGNYNINDATAEHLYDGTIVQGTGGTEVYYDGIVNYGNQGVMIQILQNGAVLADDWWNCNVGGTDSVSTAATFLTHATDSTAVNAWVGYVIKNVTDGSQALITASTATTVTGLLFGGTANVWNSGDAYLISQGLNYDTAQGISHRFLVKTRTGGADVDGRRLIGECRTYFNTYGEFKINGTARGNNVLALSDSADLNNTTAIATIAAWADVYMVRTTSGTTVSGVNAAASSTLNVASGAAFTKGDIIQTGVATDVNEYQITNITVNALTLNTGLKIATVGGETVYKMAYGYNALDISGGGGDEYYYSQWTKGAKSINQFYERMKFVSREGGNSYLYGIPGELFRGITHEITVDTPTGTFAAVEGVSWSGGTGRMLAVNSPTAATTMWIQLLTGVAPTDGQTITGALSAATVAMNIAITDRSSLLTRPFAGASTGSALIGGYGVGLKVSAPSDLAATDKVFDLTNTLITPPNTVYFTVGGLIASEDYVVVGPWDGASTDINSDPQVNYNQMALNVARTTDNITTITVGHVNGDSLTIPTDTPSSGYIRVEDNNGFYRKLHYSSRTTTEFTIDTTDGQEDFAGVNASAGKNVWISYLDKIAASGSEVFSYVYSIPNGVRQFVIKVRDGGGTPIKEYITTGNMTNTGGSVTAIRTTDA